MKAANGCPTDSILQSLKDPYCKKSSINKYSFCSTLIIMSFSVDCVVGHVFPLTYM